MNPWGFVNSLPRRNLVKVEKELCERGRGKKKKKNHTTTHQFMDHHNNCGVGGAILMVVARSELVQILNSVIQLHTGSVTCIFMYI